MLHQEASGVGILTFDMAFLSRSAHKHCISSCTSKFCGRKNNKIGFLNALFVHESLLLGEYKVEVSLHLKALAQ